MEYDLNFYSPWSSSGYTVHSLEEPGLKFPTTVALGVWFPCCLSIHAAFSVPAPCRLVAGCMADGRFPHLVSKMV